MLPWISTFIFQSPQLSSPTAVRLTGFLGAARSSEPLAVHSESQNP